MTANLGTIDRIVRVVIGLVLIAYTIPLGFAPSGWSWVGWIGVIPLATAIFGYCPLYTPFAISTCPSQNTG